MPQLMGSFANQAVYVCTLMSVLLWSVYGHGGRPHREDHEESPKVIIISFDGFRWDYLSRTSTPNFDRIIRNGGQARYGMKDAFITKTLPNHFTLVTGLYEESHGIVGNTMFDPVLNETFEVENRSQMAASRWFDVGAEPIWVTNQVQKKSGRSGCMMWVGCEAPIKGVVPTRHVPFDGDMTIETRIDETIEWFKSTYPVNLGLIYYEEPDHTGHKFGPDSPEVTAMIGTLDKVVGHLLKKLEEADLLDDVNIILTSDHGFTATGPNRIVNLDDYIDPNSYRIFSSSPEAAILPNEGLEEEVFANLSAGAKSNPNFKVYNKSTIPEEFHFTHNRRIMPILVSARENYSIVFNHSTWTAKGNHGYNNSLQDMHPYFLAMGPGFRKGAEVASFENVDVYPLMCHLLGLVPAPNNGSLHPLLPLLREKDEKTTVMTFGTYFFVLLVIGSVGGVFAVAACRQHRYLKRMQRSRVIALEGGVKYSLPPANGGAKVPLLSEPSDEETFH
ncbi:ectonucleotide pyrophosphatase/phosphodiesterase family member 5-like [Babylonia areolata]|uniref:ectonucleotide pyrophosphatase/phosphodiesterase family member 5-like n=1 Tax=Babylonia areolata TaxID=304850 RepID=UPI003FD1B286